MKDDGFSLIELLIVIAIIGIILAIGSINFHSWQLKAQVESQTRTLFATLNQARVDAFQFKQPRSVVLQTDGYTFNTYTDENQARTAGTAVQKQTVTFTLTEPSGPSDNVTLFDVRGYTSDTGTFQFNSTGTGANVDCVVVDQGRTNIGKMTNGVCTIK